MAELLPDGEQNVHNLRRFMPIRLIVVDLDGTLIPAELSQTIQEFARRLRRHEVLLTLATGRTLCGVTPLLEKLNLAPGIPLILYNGSVVVANQTFEVLCQTTISASNLMRVIEIASNHGLSALAYFYNDPKNELMHVQGTHEHILGWAPPHAVIERPEREFNGGLVQWQDTMTMNAAWAPSAILLDTTRSPLGAFNAEMELGSIPGISITRSGASYIEIRPHGSNKGVALECAAKVAKVHLNEILAIGDNDNDVEMLSCAGIGVAINTASPLAIAHSDYISHHGPFEGVVEVLRLVKSAKRYFGIPKS